MIEDYNNLKIKRTEKVWILRIDTIKNSSTHIDEDSLVIEFRGDTTFQYKDLADLLPKNDPRMIILDFDYETDEPRKTNKLILFNWCPVASPITKKFKYASTSGSVASTLGAIQKIMQVSDYSDLEFSKIRASCLSK